MTIEQKALLLLIVDNDPIHTKDDETIRVLEELKELGLVEIERNGYWVVTNKGLEEAGCD